MLGLSKEVINKSRFCDWKTIIFFNYIYDTNRLPLWSVFWYLMYSFMNLIYTRKVNLYQAWIVIFIKHFFHIMYFIHVRATSSTCISQMHQTLKYVFSCVGISPCYYVFYYIYLWKEVPLVYFIRMFQRGSSHGIHPGSNSLNWYLNQQNTYKAFT